MPISSFLPFSLRLVAGKRRRDRPAVGHMAVMGIGRIAWSSRFSQRPVPAQFSTPKELAPNLGTQSSDAHRSNWDLGSACIKFVVICSLFACGQECQLINP